MLTPALQRNNDSVTTDNEPRTGEILGPGV
jgi:hypothetical protein